MLMCQTLSTRTTGYCHGLSTQQLQNKNTVNDHVSRRRLFHDGYFMTATVAAAAGAGVLSSTMRTQVASAYTPDPDPLKESLYLISRVQEASVLQERYINKKLPPIKKMKLTLRLVDRSYRLLDQINYVSKFLDPNDIVVAVQAGNEAAESLQDAIDFVYGFQKDGDAMTMDQKRFLLDALKNTREKLFEFLDYLPDQSKVMAARKRVEDENKLNVDEFDPDLANDAGIFNPIELPWKNRQKT
eukprot:scaffold158_cov105-Cylindrotheca_fusiformis.AAC.8